MAGMLDAIKGRRRGSEEVTTGFGNGNALLGAPKAAVAQRADCGFAGLVNQGATCYLNSLLQTLYCLDDFRLGVFAWRPESEETATESTTISSALQGLFAELAVADRHAVPTLRLTNAFGWNDREAWVQHDVSEAQTVLLDALEVQGLKGVSDRVTGRQEHFVACQECKTVRARPEPFLSLLIPVRGHANIDSSMRSFLASETLSGDNQYACEVCSKKTDATKGLRLPADGLPPMLFIQLGRFEFDMATLSRRKVHDPLPPALFLDMKVYTHAIVPSLVEGQALESDSESVRERAEDLGYDLAALLMHSGGATGGHYFAYIRRPASDVPALSQQRSLLKDKLAYIHACVAAGQPVPWPQVAALAYSSIGGAAAAVVAPTPSCPPYTHFELVAALYEEALLALGGGIDWAWLHFNDSSVEAIPADYLPKALGQPFPAPTSLPEAVFGPPAVLPPKPAHGRGEDPQLPSHSFPVAAALSSSSMKDMDDDKDSTLLSTMFDGPLHASNVHPSLSWMPEHSAASSSSSTAHTTNAYIGLSSKASAGPEFASSSSQYYAEGITGAYMLCYVKRGMLEATFDRATAMSVTAGEGGASETAAAEMPKVLRHGAELLPATVLNRICKENVAQAQTRAQIAEEKKKISLLIKYRREALQALMAATVSPTSIAFAESGLTDVGQSPTVASHRVCNLTPSGPLAMPGCGLDWSGTRTDKEELDSVNVQAMDSSGIKTVLRSVLKALVQAEYNAVSSSARALRSSNGERAGSGFGKLAFDAFEETKEPPSAPTAPCPSTVIQPDVEDMVTALLPHARLRVWNGSNPLPGEAIQLRDEQGDGPALLSITRNSNNMILGVEFRRSLTDPWVRVVGGCMTALMSALITPPVKLPDVVALRAAAIAVLVVPKAGDGLFPTVGDLREAAAAAITSMLPSDTHLPRPLPPSRVRLSKISGKDILKVIDKDERSMNCFQLGEHCVAEVTREDGDDALSSAGSELARLCAESVFAVSIIINIPLADEARTGGRLNAADNVLKTLHGTVIKENSSHVLIDVPWTKQKLLVRAHEALAPYTATLEFTFSVDRRASCAELRKRVCQVLLALAPWALLSDGADLLIGQVGFPLRFRRVYSGNSYNKKDEDFLTSDDEAESVSIAETMRIQMHAAEIDVQVTPGLTPLRNELIAELFLPVLATAIPRVMVPSTNSRAMEGLGAHVLHTLYGLPGRLSHADGLLMLLAARPEYEMRPLGSVNLPRTEGMPAVRNVLFDTLRNELIHAVGEGNVDPSRILLRAKGDPVTGRYDQSKALSPQYGTFDLGKPFLSERTLGSHLRFSKGIEVKHGEEIIVQCVPKELEISNDDVLIVVARLNPAAVDVAHAFIAEQVRVAEGAAAAEAAKASANELLSPTDSVQSNGAVNESSAASEPLPSASFPGVSFLFSEELYLPKGCNVGRFASASAAALGLTEGLIPMELLVASKNRNSSSGSFFSPSSLLCQAPTSADVPHVETDEPVPPASVTALYAYVVGRHMAADGCKWATLTSIPHKWTVIGSMPPPPTPVAAEVLIPVASQRWPLEVEAQLTAGKPICGAGSPPALKLPYAGNVGYEPPVAAVLFLTPAEYAGLAALADAEFAHSTVMKAQADLAHKSGLERSFKSSAELPSSHYNWHGHAYTPGSFTTTSNPMIPSGTLMLVPSGNGDDDRGLDSAEVRKAEHKQNRANMQKTGIGLAVHPAAAAVAAKKPFNSVSSYWREEKSFSIKTGKLNSSGAASGPGTPINSDPNTPLTTPADSTTEPPMSEIVCSRWTNGRE